MFGSRTLWKLLKS